MELSQNQRIVIKVGSSLIAPNGNGCSSRYLLSIANFIVKCRIENIQVVLVSSGSVAAGRALFREKDHGKESVAYKKALAAAGQAEMLAAWSRLFDFPTAQLLLTQSDLQHHERFISIRQTIDELLDSGILPIINENDAVTTDALSLGDNDNLSAMVAASISADTLIICSDVNGLYDADPRIKPDAKLIKDVRQITQQLFAQAGGAGSEVGTGGMRTKLEAAYKATQRGIPTLIMNGHNESGFEQFLKGKNPGTLFHPSSSPLDQKQHWLAFGTKAQGEVVISEEVLDKAGNEEFDLQYKDILDVTGDFSAGDTVVVKTQSGDSVAKAKTRQGSCLLQFLVEKENKPHTSVQNEYPLTEVLNPKEMTILEE